MNGRVIALGFFDGVHLGHGALLRRTRQRADETGLQAAAMTFDAHPSALLQRQPVPLLSTPQDRAALMRRLYGIDEVLIAHFDQTMLTEPWDVFLSQRLTGQLQARHVVCGHNYHFGYRGLGDPEKLRAWCNAHGIGCDVIDQVRWNGQDICSTRIRALLTAGQLEEANCLLGHPHCLSGPVIPGQHLGHTLGIPTANLAIPAGICCLPYGVYATKVWVGETPYTAVTNVGTRPTVGGDHATVESWLLHFTGDLYGRQIRVDFHLPLRPEQKFSSLSAMQAEIRRNAQQAEDYFAAQAKK